MPAVATADADLIDGHDLCHYDPPSLVIVATADADLIDGHYILDETITRDVFGRNG